MYKLESFQIRIGSVLRQRAQRYAERQDTPLSQYIREALAAQVMLDACRYDDLPVDSASELRAAIRKYGRDLGFVEFTDEFRVRSLRNTKNGSKP